jgi:hypothetical protein
MTCSSHYCVHRKYNTARVMSLSSLRIDVRIFEYTKRGKIPWCNLVFEKRLARGKHGATRKTRPWIMKCCEPPIYDLSSQRRTYLWNGQRWRKPTLCANAKDLNAPQARHTMECLASWALDEPGSSMWICDMRTISAVLSIGNWRKFF